jgi:transcriptional regulator with XRE-family HTH domain
LDPTKVATARLAAGYSVHALARLLGVSQSAIRSLEEGINHRELNLGLLADLAHALQQPPADLFYDQTPSHRPPAPDDVVVEAALTELRGWTRTGHLAEALGFTLERTRAALQALGERLEGSGIQLESSTWGITRLRPAPGVLNETQRRLVARDHTRRLGLTKGAARMLLAISAGQLDGRGTGATSAFERLTLAQLANQGLIHKPRGKLIRLTRDAELGLALDPLAYETAGAEFDRGQTHEPGRGSTSRG